MEVFHQFSRFSVDCFAFSFVVTCPVAGSTSHSDAGALFQLVNPHAFVFGLCVSVSDVVGRGSASTVYISCGCPSGVCARGGGVLK